MKKIFVFGTKLSMYLCEVPIILLLCAAIHFNDGLTNTVKLYPLIIACIAGIVFMFIYLLRGVIISGELVRSFGPFSSRDRAIINKDKTLVLTIRPKGKLKIELFGADDAPDLDWVDKESRSNRDYVNLYRDIAIGGVGTVKRILGYFNVPSADIPAIIAGEGYEKEYTDIKVCKEKTELGDVYSIKFLRTI